MLLEPRTLSSCCPRTTCQVADEGDLTVQGIHLTRGRTRGSGGAIVVAAGARATLLENTTISDSHGSSGGGLNILGGDVTLTNSSVVNCSAAEVRLRTA